MACKEAKMQPVVPTHTVLPYPPRDTVCVQQTHRVSLALLWA
jgi:hypothetical protein